MRDNETRIPVADSVFHRRSRNRDRIVASRSRSIDTFDAYVPNDNWGSYDGRNNNYNWSKGFVWSEIGYNHPLLLNMEHGESANDGTGPYNNHSVAIARYCCNVSSYRIHDTWGSDDHYLNHGAWRQSNVSSVYH